MARVMGRWKRTAPLGLRVYPLDGSEQDFDPILEMVGDARVVLIGEASHGTSILYQNMRPGLLQKSTASKVGFLTLTCSRTGQHI